MSLKGRWPVWYWPRSNYRRQTSCCRVGQEMGPARQPSWASAKTKAITNRANDALNFIVRHLMEHGNSNQTICDIVRHRKRLLC